MVNTTFISTMRRVALAGVALLVASATSVSAQDKISVDIDQAAPVKLSRPAATVVVGNPSIADIAAFDAGYFFFSFWTMGTDNVVGVVGKGETLANVL